MASSWEREHQPREGAVPPRPSEDSSSLDDGDAHRLLQACRLHRQPALVHLVIETVGGRYASTDLPGVYCGVPAWAGHIPCLVLPARVWPLMTRSQSHPGAPSAAQVQAPPPHASPWRMVDPALPSTSGHIELLDIPA